MTEQKQVELTLGERRYLERMREAQSEGVSLASHVGNGAGLRRPPWRGLQSSPPVPGACATYPKMSANGC